MRIRAHYALFIKPYSFKFGACLHWSNLIKIKRKETTVLLT